MNAIRMTASPGARASGRVSVSRSDASSSATPAACSVLPCSIVADGTASSMAFSTTVSVPSCTVTSIATEPEKVAAPRSGVRSTS